MNIDRNGRFKDIAGSRFGMLVVVRYVGTINKRAHWECRCDCGKTTTASGKLLRIGSTKSCGCLRAWMLKSGRNRLTHGHSKGGKMSKEYKSWVDAKQRCFRKKATSYKYYGQRGITMCERWKNSFELFLADMGICPAGLELDRINNNGHYEPGNCRWATKKVQQNNKNNNHRLSLNGITRTISEWADLKGVDQRMIWQRIMRGWTVERALLT